MNTKKALYLVTYAATLRGIPLGNYSLVLPGDTASDAITRFHGAMQHRRGHGPQDYHVIRFFELDPVKRTVIARLMFPQGPNPRIPAPPPVKTTSTMTATATPQTEFAF